MLLTATNKQIMEEYEVLRDLYMEWLPEEVAEWICSLGFPHYKVSQNFSIFLIPIVLYSSGMLYRQPSVWS